MKPTIVALLLLFSFNSNAQNGPPLNYDSVRVYLFLAEDCPNCQQYTPLLNELYQTFGTSIPFIGLFPNKSSRYKSISAFRDKYQIEFPLHTDHYKRKATQFGAMVTPEVVVFDHRKDQVLYKGRIDNTFYQLGKRRRVINRSELKEVLTAIQNREPITTSPSPAVGCLINFSENELTH
jgi:thiol-disulfide isomerase/thioredoxin